MQWGNGYLLQVFLTMVQAFDLAEGFGVHQGEIIDRWVDYALSSYSSSTFFKKEKDSFANPVGANCRQAFTSLFPLLVKGRERAEYEAFLEQFVSIRAVQEFSPSQALAPLNAVKHIVREVFAADEACQHLAAELYDFDFAVDLCLLAAFDIYMRYRERLYTVRLQEIRSGSHILTDSKCPSKMLKKDVSEFPDVQI